MCMCVCVYIYIWCVCIYACIKCICLYMYIFVLICRIFVLYFACISNDRQPFCMLLQIHHNLIVLMICYEILTYFQGPKLLLVVINSKLHSQFRAIFFVGP